MDRNSHMMYIKARDTTMHTVFLVVKIDKIVLKIIFGIRFSLC